MLISIPTLKNTIYVRRMIVSTLAGLKQGSRTRQQTISQSLCGLLMLLACHSVTAGNLPDNIMQLPINLLNGKTVTLADYQTKKPVYLKFWATWCQPCREQMPHFQAVQQRYGDKVAVIGINVDINDQLPAVQATIKKHGLTMPTAIDSRGDLAQSFRLLGTPYHLLIDRHGNLVHRGHEADQALDNKLALLAQTHPVDQLEPSTIAETGPALTLPIDDGKTHALFFTATWCDWYLADTRPQVAQHCIAAQQTINRLAQQNPHIHWHGIVSRLWTGEKDLAEYRKKFAVSHPVAIDQRNEWFYRFGVNDFPTLVIIEKGKEVYRLSGDFESMELPKP